jgi:SOS-response transcriptional repressor LexA
MKPKKMRTAKLPPIEILMTDTRIKILKAITAYWEREGMSPTITEIAEASGFSVGAVQQNLMPLQVAGYISRKPGLARSIQVLKTEVPQEARA